MLANLEHCEDNDKDYDPAAKYGKKTGPASIATSSPGAPARAQIEGDEDRSHPVLTDAQAGIFARVCGGRQHP